MVEYRQRLRVMLSASQGKYELERSSGTITKQINYIYYFTYFHNFELHPFWDAFEPIIKVKVEELKGSVESLQGSHKILKESVSDTYTRIDYLLYFFIRFQNILKDSIETLKKRLYSKMITNNQNASQYILSIERLIPKIQCSLQNYIKSEQDKITEELKPKKKDFEVKMKIASEIISLEISFITTVLLLVRRITHILKMGVSFTLNCKDENFIYSFDISAEMSMCSTIKELKTDFTSLFSSLGSLTCENLDFDKDIKQIDECIMKLEQKMEKLVKDTENLEQKVGESTSFEIKDPDNQTKKLEIEDARANGNKPVNLKIYSEFILEIRDILFKYQNYILEKKTRLVREISGLQEQIKVIRKELETVKSKLEELKNIKDLKGQLNGYKNKDGDKGKLEKIRQIVENFEFDEEKLKISINKKEFKDSDYFTSIQGIRETVNKLLQNEKLKNGTYSGNDNLKNIKNDLYRIKCQLENLETYGKNIKDLKLITDSLEQLKSIEKDIDKIKPSNQKNNLPNSDSTFAKLLKDDQKLNSMRNTLGSIDNEIKGINKDKPDQSKLYDIKYNIDKLKLHSESINKYNEILKDINNLEISKTNGQGGVTRELQEFSEKLGYIAVSLYAVSAYLYLYLKQNKNNDEIRFIKQSIQVNIRNNIQYIQRNISKIKLDVPKITFQYTKYTAAFTAFKDKLNKLEKCLDYLIRDFLTCSLCTTICKLKRQLRDTPWQCPDSDCNSCLRHSLLGDTVTKVEQQLYGYSRLVFGHFSTLDTKVFISKLYRCIVRVDDIVDIVQVVDCCCCVKKVEGNDSNKAGNSNNTNQANTVTHRMMTYRDHINHMKMNEETQLKAATLDTMADSDNSNHLCLCLAIRHKMYPCLLKTVTLLLQLELGVSGNIARKFGTHLGYNSYYKHSVYNNYYNKLSGCNSHNLSVSMMLLLATWAMIKLASFLEHRYKIEHDKVKCCTNEEGKCTCKSETNKNRGSSDNSSKNCCPCCKCPKANGTPGTTTTGTTSTTSNTTPCTPGTAAAPSTTPRQCCCKKTDGKKGCLQGGCNNDNNKTCCCKCCCYCVCESKIKCGCTCKAEDHCFCKKSDDCPEDPYYRWFIYVIMYICHLVDDAFSLGYWEIQQAMQLLSNLIPRLDAVCWEADRRCVTLSDKPGKDVKASTSTLPSPTCPLPVQPSSPSPVQPTTLKVKCCLVCVNVKVVCMSTRVLCVTRVLIGKCKGDKEDGKKEECNPENVDCFCKCESGKKCQEHLKKLDVKDNLKCELFKGLKEKLTELKSVNGDKAKWTLVCDCKPDTPNCPCKLTSDSLKDPCESLKKDLSSNLKELEKLNCGCESVKPCCCCCKCEECGNGKERKCNEKEEDKDKHKCHGHNGQVGDTQSASGGGNGNQAAAGTNSGEVKCPCLDGKDGTDNKCCCEATGAGEKRKYCNCTKAGEAKPETTPNNCQCCCLSCCADEKNEDKKNDEKEKQEEGVQEQPQQANTSEKNCPCKKKKKKKPKTHCKNNKKYKDKRCCCKCCPETNGGEGAPTNGGASTDGSAATTSPSSSAPNTPNGATTPTNEKDCCCCCQCKSTCNSGTTNGKCSCHNGMLQSGQTNGQQKDCKCYCCFVCDHQKSALRSICKQFAYDLKSSISVLSKLASNLTIECCPSLP